MSDDEKRARTAYEAFRGGLIWGLDHDVPRWEDAPSWIRDVALVAYLQGKLDHKPSKKEPHYKTEYGPNGMERRFQDGWIVPLSNGERECP